jgi:hypothetical protein
MSGRRVCIDDNMKHIDLEIQKTAKRQHGAICWRQVRTLRVTRRQVWERVSSGAWVRELPGVWRLSWAEPTWMHRVHCAALWGGADAFISHAAAAKLWDLDGIEREDVDLSAPHQLRTHVGWVAAHCTAPLPREMRRMRCGVAVTSPARTLVDLTGVVAGSVLERALEHALRRQLVSVPEMQRAVQRMPVKGKGGTGKVARLLDAGLWNASDQSELERQAMLLFRRCHLPVPEREYMIFDGNRRLATVDFAWPKAKVIVEAEGFRFHSGRVAWERDIARYNELVLCGWTVLRLTYESLRNGAETFAESLAHALNRSRRGGSAGRGVREIAA